MGNIASPSNSAVLIERGDLEMILRTLTAFQQASSEAAEIILRRLDNIDGDPDAETGNDVEDDFQLTPDAIEQATKSPRVDCIDQDAGAYVEWHTMRDSQKRGPMLTVGHEDDEDSDPAGQYDEDCYTGPQPKGDGPGCTISDPDFCAVERGELTTHESFIQGCGSARHEDDDDEPRRGPAIMEGEGFTYREVR